MTLIVGFMPTAPHQVVALALPGVVLLDLAAPTHLFGHCGAPRYSFRLAGLAAGNVRSSTGFDVVASTGIEALAGADTVVVPGVDDPTADSDGLSDAAAAVAAAHRRGARVMSICTGAFVLAEAGLLDGRRATTHWGAAAELARRYPAVIVEPDVLYVDEGDVLTSAGVAAGLDLCLHVIRSDHGAALAAKLARRTVIAPHRDGGQRQYVPPGRHEPVAGMAGTEPARRWALEHLAQPIGVAALASQACMSPRTFVRRFESETGITPGRWLSEQRTRAAQELLETTELPIEHVAARSGFGSPATLRAHFGRALGVTPTSYRRSFRTG
jgi:AraC family transcriptional regulator, transcriptional activator FtrA